MFAKKRNWRKILLGGAVASGILISLLYCFVHFNLLAIELAVPWITESKKVQAIDWTCLYFASFATAFFSSWFIPELNWVKGLIGGLLLALTFTLACILSEEKIFGIAYYLICYLLWGLIIGLISISKSRLIIRRFD